MNLHFSRKLFSLLPQNYQFSISSTRVLASLLFSTKTPTKPLSSSHSTTLCRRIEAIRDPRVSIVPALDQWIKEGNTVDKHHLVSLVRLMKDYKRFKHALEVSEWMTGRRFFTFTTEDAAVRLGLIHRVRGLEEAENYFNKLSVKLKTKYTYGAILNGCVREKSVQKAEAVMQEMREGGMTTSSFPYNILIILYSQTGDFDKIPPLLKEMERNGIAQDKYTLRNLIAASVAASDTSGVERILKLMEENPERGLDWKLYAMAADAYLKIGSIETALTMLKKLEKWMAFRKKKAVFNFLLSLYAKTGNKDELYRIWNSYKPSSESIDTSYCCMIDSLTKLDDIEGAEKIFEEWESQCTSMYDFRVLNGLLVAYCNRGLLEKAEAAIEKAVQGRTPYASTWHVMAKGYIEHDQIPKAVEMLKRAVNVGRDWKPDPILVNACLEYLEGQGHAEEMKEFTRLMKN
ncbi:pentatricopeptide repeat-containing protein [Populus alba x Populus x berolinensis]|nr:pentatricopeptide repeat-containing protein [Populus alba x Populus x berolinensis]